MSPAQQRTLSVGVAGTMIAALLLAFLGFVVDPWVPRSTYNLHVQAERAELSELREITLELLCEGKPSSRRCR
jgi:hypothetical protein